MLERARGRDKFKAVGNARSSRGAGVGLGNFKWLWGEFNVPTFAISKQNNDKLIIDAMGLCDHSNEQILVYNCLSFVLVHRVPAVVGDLSRSNGKI
jgi:hypothetical protein